jgi:hypothetical protein
MFDPDLLAIAAKLAGCTPADILSLRLTPDGDLVVVVNPGPKYTFTADAVRVIRAQLAHMPTYRAGKAKPANKP